MHMAEAMKSRGQSLKAELNTILPSGAMSRLVSSGLNKLSGSSLVSDCRAGMQPFT